MRNSKAVVLANCSLSTTTTKKEQNNKNNSENQFCASYSLVAIAKAFAFYGAQIRKQRRDKIVT